MTTLHTHFLKTLQKVWQRFVKVLQKYYKSVYKPFINPLVSILYKELKVSGRQCASMTHSKFHAKHDILNKFIKRARASVSVWHRQGDARVMPT